MAVGGIITATQQAQFVEDGWCTLPAVFSAVECDELIARQGAYWRLYQSQFEHADADLDDQAVAEA